MNMNRLSLFTIAICVIIVIPSFTSAQGWPQWRGANRDGKVKDFATPQTWPKELKQGWKKEVGLGDASPSLIGKNIYVFTRQGDEEVTLCLNKDTGDVIWRDAYKAGTVTGAARSHPGPRSTPTVAEGKVVTLGACGVLSCLNAANGKVVWRKDPFPNIVPRFFTSMSPLIVNGLAIAHLGGEGNGALIAYDLNSGKEIWRWAEEGPAYASPVLLTVEGKKQVVTLTENNIVGISASDGKLLWKLPFPPQRRAYNAATPIVDKQTIIYTGAGRGAKAVKIEKQGEKFVPKELWSNPDWAPQFNSPILKDGFLFGLSDRNHLYCIDAKTGKTVWSKETPVGSRGFGALVDAGQAMLVLPNNSELVVFKPDNKKYTELARYKVAESPTYAHPVLTQNRIYVKDEKAVTLWKLN